MNGFGALIIHARNEDNKSVIGIDNCSIASHCLACPRWSIIKEKSITQNFLRENFFNSRELRHERISRGVCLFMSKKDIVISKDNILHGVWRHRATLTNIPVLIYELRILLKEQNVEIVNLRGEGYKLQRKKYAAS